MSASNRRPHGFSAAYAWCFCVEFPGKTPFDHVCANGFARVNCSEDAINSARLVAEQCDPLTPTQCIMYLRFKQRCMVLGVWGEVQPILEGRVGEVLQEAA